MNCTLSHHKRVSRISDLQDKLLEAGEDVGFRMLEFISYRERPGISPWQSQESTRGIVECSLSSKMSVGSLCLASPLTICKKVWRVIVNT